MRNIMPKCKLGLTIKHLSNQNNSLIVNDYLYAMSARATDNNAIHQVCFDNDAVPLIILTYDDEYRPVNVAINQQSYRDN
jgi:hypothetical protein